MPPLASEVRRPSVLPPRGIIIDSSLALYAPLWHPDLSLSPFVSKDPHVSSFNVSGGAVWTRQGYSFDGINGRILATSNMGISGAAARTVIIWVKQTDVTGEQAFFRWGTSGNGSTFGVGMSAASGKIKFMGWGTADFDTAFTPVINVWYCYAAVYDGTSVTIYRDVIADAPVVSVLNTVNAPLNIGDQGLASQPTKGGIGEIIAYTRAFVPAELQTISLATKWRYN